MHKFSKLAATSAIAFITGCAGGGGAAGLLGNPYGANAIANTAMGGGMGGALLNSVIQGMAGNVLNGQIGSQMSSTDQNFRLQQLGNVIQSGNINQSQQWTNPQTGNTVALNPIGQTTIHPQTQQQCQNIQETATTPNGQRITENRLACLDTQTGKWNFVQ